MTSTESPNSSLLRLGPQLAEALDGQLALARAARCARASSKRFIAIWRKTVAIEPSIDSASSDSRDSGVGRPARAGGRRRASRRTPTRSRPASAACAAGGRRAGAASAACTPWPSSWASVSTSRRLRGVVEHHVRVHGRDGVGAERAAALAGRGPARRSSARRRTRWATSPSSGENDGVGVEHELARLGPARSDLLVGDHGGHAVVVGEPVDAEQLAPSARTSAAGGRSGRAPPRRSACDRLVGGLVGEVAAASQVG